MEYSTVGPGQEISAEGVVYDKGSIYDRLQSLTELRKARGKRYGLTTVLMIVLLAKLSGANSSTEIAESASTIRLANEGQFVPWMAKPCWGCRNGRMARRNMP